MTKTLYCLTFFVLCCSFLSGFNGETDPLEQKAVDLALIKAGKNRIELEKAISYFKKANNPLKLRAVYFLIANMDIHSSATYGWVDNKGNNIPYDELSYPTVSAAKKALELLKMRHPGMHVVAEEIPDIGSIKADLLIQPVNDSFSAWRSSPAKDIPFEEYCEYILPYRVSVEPIEPWVEAYRQRFSWLGKSINTQGLQKGLSALSVDVSGWFTVASAEQVRKEPLPRLGAMQLLFRKLGPCEDVADLSAFIFRSQGIPVALDVVPYWATSTGSHFSTTVFFPQMHPNQFDLSRANALGSAVPREPSKVLRITYSRQPNTLASFVKPNDIPEGFMRTENYKDVTQEYWKTSDVSCPLFPSAGNKQVAYACVFNGLKWRPTWWSRIGENSAIFGNMSKGVVYLPVLYNNNKLVPAGFPVAEGYTHAVVLAPDMGKRITVDMKQESGYLNYKMGRTYRLYYWNNKWELIGQQTAGLNTTELFFPNVPSNSLMLMVVDHSTRKERPFIIANDGKRIWF